jgi:hypothetical protein
MPPHRPLFALPNFTSSTEPRSGGSEYGMLGQRLGNLKPSLLGRKSVATRRDGRSEKFAVAWLPGSAVQNASCVASVKVW